MATELWEGRYRPLPTRRVLIPKPGDKAELRPLSIPAVRDWIVQSACKIVLEPIFEADMLPCSFGFRPKRSPHDALQVLVDEAWRGRRWVVETDIANCFSVIPHDKLMQAKNIVHTGHQSAQRLVPGRQHHPEPRPRQPRAEQLRAASTDTRPFAPVELQPHPRLRNPRPILAPVPGLERRFRLGHRLPRRAVGTGEPHRDQALMHHIGADPAPGILDEFLDLAQERVDQPSPPGGSERIPTGVTDRDITGDGLLIHTGKLRRRVGAACPVERFQDLHDFPVRLT